MGVMDRRAIRNRMLGYRATQVLTFVRQRIEIDGHAPTYRQIMAGTGISTKGEVSRIVDALERRRLLSRVGEGKVRVWRRTTSMIETVK